MDNIFNFSVIDSILYIHGMKSNGDNSQVHALESKYNVISPTLPHMNPDKIWSILTSIDPNSYKLIVAHSMGTIFARCINKPKILINPAYNIEKIIRDWDEANNIKYRGNIDDIISRYRYYLNKASRDKSDQVYGVVGVNDTLCPNSYNDLKNQYGTNIKIIKFNGDHNITQSEIRDYVFPLIDKIVRNQHD